MCRGLLWGVDSGKGDGRGGLGSSQKLLGALGGAGGTRCRPAHRQPRPLFIHGPFWLIVSLHAPEPWPPRTGTGPVRGRAPAGASTVPGALFAPRQVLGRLGRLPKVWPGDLVAHPRAGAGTREPVLDPAILPGLLEP